MKDNELVYDWLDFMALQKGHKNLINEATLRNFVSGRNAQLAQAVGAIDFEVVDVGGKYGDSIKFGQGDEWINKDDMHFEINVSGLPPPNSSELENQNYQDDQEGVSSIMSDILGMAFKAGSAVKKENLIREESHKHLSIFKIKDSKEQIFKNHKKYFVSLLSYIKEKLNLNKDVYIVFEDDEKNSKKVLGRTGGYINHENKIHIFITGRHIKDIMRSLSHELVHHRQNIRGEFKKEEPTKDGYAQSNKHLRNMEKEAYLKGNMLFRDWEDNYKYRGEK